MKIREILSAGSISAPPTRRKGSSPYTVFILDNGQEISVVHEGDHISIRNKGIVSGTMLSVEPVAGNTINVRPR